MPVRLLDMGRSAGRAPASSQPPPTQAGSGGARPRSPSGRASRPQIKRHAWAGEYALVYVTPELVTSSPESLRSLHAAKV
jgi:hypothetical protein